MITLKKHILFSLSVFFVMGGLVCLNVHNLTHLNTQPDASHQTGSDSTPAKQLSDDCAICILSAFGFAEPENGEFIPVYNGNEQVTHPSLPLLSKPAVSAASPRAPPFS